MIILHLPTMPEETKRQRGPCSRKNRAIDALRSECGKVKEAAKLLLHMLDKLISRDATGFLVEVIGPAWT